MNVHPSVSAAEKAELLSLFDAPVTPAPRRRHRPGMLAHKIHGWQAERRRALQLLRRMTDAARARSDHTHADAYLWAMLDVEDSLRSSAAATIEESCRMSFAHVGAQS